MRRHASRRRIEGRERLVGDEHVGAGERVQQRRLAHVRVSDQRAEEETFAAARFAAALALLLHLCELRAQVDEPLLDHAAIRFEERLTRTARADATTLPRKALPDATQSRHLVLQLRDLDLHAAFLRARVAREDVEDHRRAVDDAAVRDRLETALLRRGELVIGDDDVGRDARGLGRELLGLALPHPGVRIGRAALLDGPPGDDRARSLHERGQLVERVLRLEARARLIQPDEVGTLGRRTCIDHSLTMRSRRAPRWRMRPDQQSSDRTSARPHRGGTRSSGGASTPSCPAR